MDQIKMPSIMELQKKLNLQDEVIEIDSSEDEQSFNGQPVELNPSFQISRILSPIEKVAEQPSTFRHIENNLIPISVEEWDEISLVVDQQIGDDKIDPPELPSTKDDLKKATDDMNPKPQDSEANELSEANFGLIKITLDNNEEEKEFDGNDEESKDLSNEEIDSKLDTNIEAVIQSINTNKASDNSDKMKRFGRKDDRGNTLSSSCVRFHV